MRARYYEANTGRFISEDPSHKGSNWTTYCRNDPVNMCDQSGRLIWELLGAVLIAIVAIFFLPEAAGLAVLVCWGLIAIGGALILKDIVEDISEFVTQYKENVLGAPWHGEDPETRALSLVNDMKTSGNALQKIMAGMAEIDLWLAFDESDD